MSPSPRKPGPLLIRKYSNRRFYDTTRSCNVTLEDLHGLIADGWDLKISDSKSDADITNVVLTQLILDHHAPKLAIFPTAILHQIIRTQQQFLGGVVEQFFRQTLEAQRETQENWARFLQNTLGFSPPTFHTPQTPLDWMRSVWPTPGRDERRAHDTAAATSADGGELEVLRQQVDELARRLRELTESKPAP